MLQKGLSLLTRQQFRESIEGRFKASYFFKKSDAIFNKWNIGLFSFSAFSDFFGSSRDQEIASTRRLNDPEQNVLTLDFRTVI